MNHKKKVAENRQKTKNIKEEILLLKQRDDNFVVGLAKKPKELEQKNDLKKN